MFSPLLENNDETNRDCSADNESQGDQIQLSLHALASLPSFKTVKVCGSHYHNSNPNRHWKHA